MRLKQTDCRLCRLYKRVCRPRFPRSNPQTAAIDCKTKDAKVKMFYSFLFPRYANQRLFSLFLLAMRLFLGILFMIHGFDKLNHYSELSVTFPDPLGIGSRLSLLLVLFGELVCSAAFIIGFLYRLCMIPMMVDMLVAFVFVHHGSLAHGELALVYLVMFILMYAAGPGVYSVDFLIDRSLTKMQQPVELHQDGDAVRDDEPLR